MISNGVRIVELKAGKLRSAGISKGFIILSLDDENVQSKAHFFELLESKQGGVLIEGIYPDSKKAYYGFGL